MWGLEFFFFFFFLFILVHLMLNVTRLLMFLIYLEILSLLILYFLINYMLINDYTIMLVMLMSLACESAIGLSLLVMVVRNFSVDQIKNHSLTKIKCEGF